MIKVRVPATSANMGAGFDTLGVALSLYNTLEISEIPKGLEVFSNNRYDYIPRDTNNLVYRSMMSVFNEVEYKPSGIRIVQNSEIPVTRGLGSSSACIIGGMIAANIISGRHLAYNNILDLAVKMEGHPDNVAPALYGGFCVSMVENSKTICHSTKLNSKIKFAVMVPDFFVATRKSRGTLPNTVLHSDAAFNVSRAAMFAMSLANGKTENLRYTVEDRLHQPYRKKYIDGMDEIFEKTYEFGSKATYLSGSGPTILSILDSDYREFNIGMTNFFKKNTQNWRCRILSIDNVGAIVQEVK